VGGRGPVTRGLERIRTIFLQPRAHVTFDEATELLGWSNRRMRRAIKAGEIEVTSTSIGALVWREELIAKALETWAREVIEEALGVEVERVLPYAVQLTDLHTRVPRYQVSMLEYFGGRDQTTVSEVLVRELDGVANAHADDLSATVTGFATALGWPSSQHTPVC
jgi:hypothetical protein